jgi:hypothetical protein
MFQEIVRAPFGHAKSFRSPVVAGFSFVNGSIQAVMTPLWTPGGVTVLLAPAIAATTAKMTAPADTSSFVEGAFMTPASLPASSGGGSSAPRICFEARQEVAQVDRFSAIYCYRGTERIRDLPPAAASRFRRDDFREWPFTAPHPEGVKTRPFFCADATSAITQSGTATQALPEARVPPT